MSRRHPDPTSQRSTAQGDVIGFSFNDQTHAWWGLPYAAPPVGELRWRAPRKHPGWSETRECLNFGRMSAQLKSFMTLSPPQEWNRPTGSEDCLTLNVFAPKQIGNTPLPVMMWIHGGGNTSGASSMYPIAGNLPAHGNVIVVSVNYRLGVMGWFYHPALFDENCTDEDRSGNFGTLDLIQALRWIQENIAHFGGDPKNVTIFGESAGGQNVMSLYVSPLAKGLFHKAIAQSPLTVSVSHEDGFHFHEDQLPGARGNSIDVLAKLLQHDGKAKDKTDAVAQIKQMSAEQIRSYLFSQSAEELISTFHGGSVGIYESPRLFQDGLVLPAKPMLDAFADPAYLSEIPILLGTNRDEFKLFMAMNPNYVKMAFGKVPLMKDPTQYQIDADYFSALWKATGVDEPMRRLYQTGHRSIYVYRFDWDEIPPIPVLRPDILIGAAHAMEVPFVFRDIAGKFNIMKTFTKLNEKSRITLTKIISQYWINFAHNADPNGPNLPEWRRWHPCSNSFQGKNTLVMDDEGEGGVRMTDTDASFEAVKHQLKSDKRLSRKVKERCRLYAQLFLYAGISQSSGSLEEYEQFGKNGKAPAPAHSFRPKSFL